ncbi:MAG: hypothetical protein V3U55_08960 [Mycobacterium sp.]
MTGANHLDCGTALLDVSMDHVLVSDSALAHRTHNAAGAEAAETNIFGIRHARQSPGCLPLPKERT